VESTLTRSDLAPWGERAWVRFLGIAPLRTYSRVVRALSATPVPGPLRAPLLGSIASRLGMDLGEAEHGVEGYGSLQELFVRRLRPGARPLDPAPGSVVSPVDGCLSAAGVVRRGELIQAKGLSYSLERLLGDGRLAQQLDGGRFFTLYLRPRDYHRIHSPVDGRVTALRRIPGDLLPVQPHVVRNVRDLFARNERLVLRLDTALGAMALVCVAATGVGNISVAFSDPAGGNGAGGTLSLPVSRGDELAAFNLGSTVILVFEPQRMVAAELAPGQEVRVGMALGRAAASMETQQA
jgi:phosphatidylserine decarboxylase